MLMLFQRLRGIFWLFSIVILPGTFFHELCHLCVGGVFGGKPRNFTILPRREGRAYVMGSVTFAQVRWYNAFFMGMAPLLLLPAAYGLLSWRLQGGPTPGWVEVLWLYLIANLVYASLPSWQDLRVAARSPIGWLLLASAAGYGWYRYQAAKPFADLNQFEESGLTRSHPPCWDPSADIGLGQAHKIS